MKLCKLAISLEFSNTFMYMNNVEKYIMCYLKDNQKCNIPKFTGYLLKYFLDCFLEIATSNCIFVGGEPTYGLNASIRFLG